jgi:hypothetical protein
MQLQAISFTSIMVKQLIKTSKLVHVVLIGKGCIVCTIYNGEGMYRLTQYHAGNVIFTHREPLAEATAMDTQNIIHMY